MKTDLYIQAQGKQTDYKMLIDMAKEIWKAEGKRVKDLVSVELYYKPEESNCYYVMNGSEKGQFFV